MAAGGLTVADQIAQEADAQPRLTLRGLATEVDSSNDRSIRGINHRTVRTLPKPAVPLVVSTSRTGRPHVTLAGAIKLDCTSRSGPDAWVIPNGSPIETSLRTIPAGMLTPIMVVGVTEDTVAPGEHGLEVGIACFSGDPIPGGRPTIAYWTR